MNKIQKTCSLIFCFTSIVPLTVSASKPNTNIEQSINTNKYSKENSNFNELDISLKLELNGEENVNLNKLDESYYEKEKLKKMDTKDKIIWLNNIKEITIPPKKEEPIQTTATTNETNIIKEEKKESTRIVIDSANSDYQYNNLEGDTIEIPSGLGSIHTYMGWQLITAPDSMQYQLKTQSGMPFDNEGFGVIDGRYVIACTTTFGRIGDYIDFYQEDGSIIPCIIGDIKSQGDTGCTIWGHQNGQCIIEFVVDYDSWYYSGHSNPGNQECHPEWNQNIIKAVKGPNWFDLR